MATFLKYGVVVSIAIFLVACEPAPPTESDARAALERSMRANFPKAPTISVTRFSKTNGQSMNTAGVALYQMYYSATIEFPQGFVPARGDFWGEFKGGMDMMGILMMLSNSGFKVVKGGKPSEPQVLEANSVMTFQKTERGWMASQ